MYVCLYVCIYMLVCWHEYMHLGCVLCYVKNIPRKNANEIEQTIAGAKL